MPAGVRQDDSASLLHMVARDIEQLGNVEILDLIYHDFLDDNVVSRPYVNVYFRRQST